MTATGLKYYAAIILSVFISSGVWAQIPFESSGTPSTMSYYWGDQRVKLTVNPGQFALYIPPSSEDDAPVKLNRLLESQGIVLAEELIEAMIGGQMLIAVTKVVLTKLTGRITQRLHHGCNRNV